MSVAQHRVALVGYGKVAALHAAVYRLLPILVPELGSRTELVVVVDLSAEARQRAQSQLGIPAVAQLQEAFGQYDVNVVDCCVPTFEHFDVCSTALSRNASVICEKPLTANPVQTRALIEAAKQHRIGVNFNFRFVPAIQELKRLLDEDFGSVSYFRIEYHRASNINRWQSNDEAARTRDRGALLDICPHVLDLMAYLFGQPNSFSAHSCGYDGSAGPAGADDQVEVTALYGGGTTGKVVASKITPRAENDLTIEVSGSRRSVYFESANPNEFQLKQNNQVYQRVTTSSRSSPLLEVIPIETPTGVLQWHSCSLVSFLTSVDGSASMAATALDGLIVDQMIEGILCSLRNDSEMIFTEGLCF